MNIESQTTNAVRQPEYSEWLIQISDQHVYQLKSPKPRSHQIWNQFDIRCMFHWGVSLFIECWQPQSGCGCYRLHSVRHTQSVVSNLVHKIQGSFILIYFSLAVRALSIQKKISWPLNVVRRAAERSLNLESIATRTGFFRCFSAHFMQLSVRMCMSGAFTRLNLFWISDGVHLCGNGVHCVCVRAAQSVQSERILASN